MTIEEDLIKLFDKMADDPRFDKYPKPHIDEECVECCKMVDIAANLQQKLDKCREQIKRLRTTVREEYRAVDDRDRTINKHIDNATWYRHVIAEREKTIDLKQETIDELRGVLDIKMRTIDDFKTIEEELSRLKPPEPPIEEEHRIIVEVNSVEDVNPIVEKIAKSVAALTGNHVTARVQFVTPNDDMSAYLELP